MELTMHAQKRLRQRGFPFASPEIILSYGREERAKGNAIRYFFGKNEYEKADQEIKRQDWKTQRQLKQTLHLLDKCKHSIMVVSGGSILTLYKNVT